LLQYRLADGAIVSFWEANTPELLAPQFPGDDPTYGYLQLASTHAQALTSAEDLYERWRIIDDAVVAKAQVVLTATPTPFAADGVAVCLVTVDPFVACTLLVNGQPLVLTPEDTTVELTSDVPATFRLALRPMATHWATPITVEAL
jgi:hypothetical protein